MALKRFWKRGVANVVTELILVSACITLLGMLLAFVFGIVDDVFHTAAKYAEKLIETLTNTSII